MSKVFQLVTVIPCYNEATYFRQQDYECALSQYPDMHICFVNDGSKDHTQEVLQALQQQYSSQVTLVKHEVNQGKAAAVRTGMQYAFAHFDFQYIGYLDADLATSIEEFVAFQESFTDNRLAFCFGSRVARVGAFIQRKRSRFLIGRIIATLVSTILKLKVYDTQCGCKLFTKSLAQKVFEWPFMSTWLFDVEIFARIIKIYKEKSLEVMLEIPLKSWIDQADSKVSYTYMFKLLWDLYRIRSKYRKDLVELRY